MSETIFAPQPFVGKHDDTWRRTKRIVGQVNGIPGSRGVMVATNGILCQIEQSGPVPFIGHIAWFVPDDKTIDIEHAVKHPAAPLKRKVDFTEYV